MTSNQAARLVRLGKRDRAPELMRGQPAWRLNALSDQNGSSSTLITRVKYARSLYRLGRGRFGARAHDMGAGDAGDVV